MTDDQIERLLTLAKIVNNPRARGTANWGVRRINYSLRSTSGEFALYIRQNIRIAENFSCGLLYFGPNGGEKITLCRYNGSDHPHGNVLESPGTVLHGCHIHKATARYIAAGRKPEGYAEHTNRYIDLSGAILAIVSDCNITGLPAALTEPAAQGSAEQLGLFDDSDN